MTRAWSMLVATGLATTLCTLSPGTAHPADEADLPNDSLLGTLLHPLIPDRVPAPTSPPTSEPEPALNPAEALAPPVAADPAPGPGRQWSLHAERMVLHAPRLHGVTTTQVDGRSVRVLRITADGIDLHMFVQRAHLPGSAVLRISADHAQIRPDRRGPVEVLVRQMSGTLAVAGRPMVPVLLAAPPLAVQTDPALLQLPELALTDTTLHSTGLANATLKLTHTTISIE